MPSIFDWSSTASSNTTLDGINVNTGMSPANVDNAIRSLMAVARSTFASGLQNFLSGVSGLGVANGGTGATTLTGILKGNGTSAVTAIPLTSNTKKFLRDDGSFAAPVESIQVAITGQEETLAAGTSKFAFRMPYAFTLTAVRASLKTAQTSGSLVTVDINESGVSILSTKLTFDNTEKTTTTAAAAAVISDSALADDAEISIDIDQVGDGTAKGLIVTLIGYQS